MRPFEALHADLSKQLRDAWEATGVAGTVKGMTTLADVIGVTKADLLDALADNAAKYEALAPVAEQCARCSRLITRRRTARSA